MTDQQQSIDEAWDELHASPRFRPSYPSEAVVRFLAGRFGMADEDGPSRILDLGCGAGRHLRLIEDFGHDAIGMDYSATGLEYARHVVSERTRRRLARFTFESTPLAPQSLDGIIAWGVLCYTTSAGFRATVSQLRSALRPSGRLLVVTRTVADHRFGGGRALDDRTFRIEMAETNERGMLMHFLDRDDIDEIFAGFSHVSVDRSDHTAGNGALVNSDWIIEATR